jgi:hypothetical protein
LRSKCLSAAAVASFFFGMMCLLVMAGCGGSHNNTTTGTTTTAVKNTVALTAGFGPNGSAGGFVNEILTNITVCQHGTTTCVPINNVLVDTGSIGLRLIPSALGSLTLTQIMQGGNALEECIQYGDTSYSWGPMELADVEIAGETASNIPVQVIGATNFTVPGNCLTMTPVAGQGNNDTVQTLGANGILGIGGNNGSGDGEGIVDCGSLCTTVSFTSGYPYYTCPNGNCGEVAVPTINQAANPVAAFSSLDKNGVMITFPSVSPTGATTLSGTMNFGIGTQTDNALNNVTLYAMDVCGDFPTIRFNGISYTDSSCTTSGGSGLGGFLDTGSNGLFILDASALSSFGISDCVQSSHGSGFYCTGGGVITLSNIALLGNGNVGSGTISLNIDDATTLVNTNNSVFNDLGSDSVTTNPSPSTDFFDLGAPFFFGRTVFVGIAGESVPNGANAPNGFVAF